MPPIPVHLDDPITPTKAEGVTPKTAEQAANVANNIPTTTTQAVPASAYPPAQPGAAAVPAPTPYVAQPPPAPTRTTQAQDNGPPPPQPAAFPAPFSRQVTSTQPPPRLGETLQQTLPPTSTFPPPQMAIPPPSANQAPTHTTSTTAFQPLVAPGPTTLNLGPVNSPAQPAATGYRQDTMAQEMSAAQRGEQEKKNNDGWLGGDATATTGEGVWGALKGMAGTVGQKLVETEEVIWKNVVGGNK